MNTFQSPNWQIMWFSATKVKLRFGLDATEQSKPEREMIIGAPQTLTCF